MWLGTLDSEKKWLPIIEELGTKDNGIFVFSSGLSEISRSSRITHHISAVVNQDADLNSLIEFALKNEKQAELVCSILSAAKPNFWSIAFKIVEKYPGNLEIKEILSQIALDSDWYGNVLEKLEAHRKKLEQLLDDEETPSAAFDWVEELLAIVNNRIEREKMRES